MGPRAARRRAGGRAGRRAPRARFARDGPAPDRREPVAYILGRKGFRDLELAVDRRALIPRPETELLVEVALELRPETVLDVGTGLRRRRARDRRRAARGERRRHRHLAGGARARARERRAGSGSADGVELVAGTLPAGRRFDLVRRQPALRPRGRMGAPRARDHPLRAARGARRGRATASRRSARLLAGAARLRRDRARGRRRAGRAVAELVLDAAGFARRRAPPATSPGIERVLVAGVAMSAIVSIARDGATSARGRARALRRARAASALFPADTVYGLACDPLDPEAVDRINALKGRAGRQAERGHVLRPARDARADRDARARARARRSRRCCRAR